MHTHGAGCYCWVNMKYEETGTRTRTTWIGNCAIHLTTHNARIKYTQDGKFCTTSVRKALTV